MVERIYIKKYGIVHFMKFRERIFPLKSLQRYKKTIGFWARMLKRLGVSSMTIDVATAYDGSKFSYIFDIAGHSDGPDWCDIRGFERYSHIPLNSSEYVALYDSCRRELGLITSHVLAAARCPSSAHGSISNFVEGKTIAYVAALAERTLWLNSRTDKADKPAFVYGERRSIELARKFFSGPEEETGIHFQPIGPEPIHADRVSPSDVLAPLSRELSRNSSRPDHGRVRTSSKNIALLLSTTIPQYLAHVPLIVSALKSRLSRDIVIISSADLLGNPAIALPEGLQKTLSEWAASGAYQRMPPRLRPVPLFDKQALSALGEVHGAYWWQRRESTLFPDFSLGEKEEAFAEFVSWIAFLLVIDALSTYTERREAYGKQLRATGCNKILAVPGRTADQNLYIDIVNCMGGTSVAVEGAAIATGGNVLRHMAKGIAAVDSFQASIFRNSFAYSASRIKVIGSAEFDRFLDIYEDTKPPAGFVKGVLFLGQYLYPRDLWWPFFSVFCEWQAERAQSGQERVPLWVKCHPRQTQNERRDFESALAELSIAGKVLPADLSLESAMKIATMTASISSIAVFQGLMVGKPFVVVSDATVSFDPAKSGYGTHVRTVEDLRDAWQEATESVRNSKRYLNDNPWISDQRTYYERLADTLL